MYHKIPSCHFWCGDAGTLLMQTKEISDEYCGQHYRWQAEALMALQEASEVCTVRSAFVHLSLKRIFCRRIWCISSKTLIYVQFMPKG